MRSQVLWALDTEIEAQAFERLCADLLYRNGFKDIVPIEPQDGGRDAEEHARAGRGRDGEAAFFQFSLEKDWKAKLRRDAAKLAELGATFQTLVFVTLTKARGVDRDVLRQEIREKYGWGLLIYSRAWLRLQLEEAQPDLAKKYLDVDVQTSSRAGMKSAPLKQPNDDRLADAWRALEAGRFERAAVTLREFLDVYPEPSRKVYEALAWCQYQTHRYDEALSSINRALRIKDSCQSRSIRGCILVEKGIHTRDRASLLEGRRIFEQLLVEEFAPIWCSYFDLGNAQSALGEYAAAISSYLMALEEEPNQVEVLKNLATAYHRIGEHKLEIEYLDRALELDPLKSEALVSKGVSLMVDFDRPAEAAELLDQALKWNPEWAIRWPHVWYWLAEARHRSGNDVGALAVLTEGLSHQPGHKAMRRLKSDVLQAVVSGSQEHVTDARDFWQAHLAIVPADYGTRERLVRLNIQQGNEAAAWALLEEHLNVVGLKSSVSIRESGFSIGDCASALRFARQYLTFRKPYPVLGYWEQTDPLYGLGFPPPLSGRIEDALTSFLVVPFGLGFLALESSSAESELTKRLRGTFDTLRSHLGTAISQAGTELSGVIPTAPSARAEAADKLTEVLLFLGLIALREFGRQRGWISSQFRVSKTELDRALERYDEAQIEKDVVTASLYRLNNDLHLFPE